ncbi:MAG: hypothetical protein C0173_10125 [Desulfurella sp.]|uniref:hypothetical protein n=1 Tax=Desulfurella sp. TaxID=1962857 RepID=UPI000CC38F5B|nr:hypothetical protein [Desulfurella sp.]PMP87095.1 MAG: hypothetical protein C0173_10125 [Desulfurella sp.]
MDKVILKLKKDIKRILPMVVKHTKSNDYKSDYHKQVYFNVVDGEMVAIGDIDQSLAVITAPYLKELSKDNFQLWREDAVALTKTKTIEEAKEIIAKHGFTGEYRNYKYVIEGLGKYRFTFDVKESLEKLLQTTDETFKLTIAKDVVKINGHITKYKLLEYPETTVEFTISNKLITTGLKMIDTEKANFVFGNTYVIGLIADSFIYATVAKERYYPD